VHRSARRSRSPRSSFTTTTSRSKTPCRATTWVSLLVYVCVGERESARECVCVCVCDCVCEKKRARESVQRSARRSRSPRFSSTTTSLKSETPCCATNWVSVLVRERERERERERDRESVCVCVCGGERERERVWIDLQGSRDHLAPLPQQLPRKVRPRRKGLGVRVDGIGSRVTSNRGTSLIRMCEVPLYAGMLIE